MRTQGTLRGWHGLNQDERSPRGLSFIPEWWEMVAPRPSSLDLPSLSQSCITRYSFPHTLVKLDSFCLSCALMLSLLYAFAHIKTPLGIAFCQPCVPNLTIKTKLMYLLHLRKQDSRVIKNSDLEESPREFNSWHWYLKECVTLRHYSPPLWFSSLIPMVDFSWVQTSPCCRED